MNAFHCTGMLHNIPIFYLAGAISHQRTDTQSTHSLNNNDNVMMIVNC